MSAIIYDAETTTLLRAIHGISGTLKTGKSVWVRNYTVNLQMHGKRDAADLQLWDAIDIIAKMPSRLEHGKPETYTFRLGSNSYERELTAVHGVIDVKVGMRWEQQYRFVVGFPEEVPQILRKEFKVK